MSLFRKPKKSIQRRVFSERDDDDELMDVEESFSTEREHKKKDKSKHVPKKQPLLSFETEEEGEVFQVKKSSHSKRVMRLFEKERQKKKEPKPEKEEIKSVKEPVTEIVTDDLVLKVNSNHKPKTPSPPLILSGRDALCAGKDDLSSDEEDSARHRFSKPDKVKILLESGVIPDAAMIHAARKRRQRARELGGEFVPLEEEEPEGSGRMHREDNQDEVSDEERIDMDANPEVRDQERRREQFLAAQESDQEADQELDEWENQQIRKGVTGASAANIQPEYYNQFDPTVVQVQTPAVDPSTQRTPEAIIEKLREKFESVCASRNSHMQQLITVQDNLIEVNNELEVLKKRAPVAAERFKFYQELRGYITDLVECLDEKVGIISDLEQRALNLMAHKAEWLIERRRQDVRDQAEELTSMAKGIVRRANEDEEKVRRAAEREGRRTRRRRAREQQGQPRHVEGMSSDDEITQQDTLNFDKEREQLDGEIQEVFEDVVDDYTSVANILIRFEQWRETDMNTYTDAYATLCLPRIVGPLIRLNLIFWDPLSESVELEKLEWYRTLALYGLHDDETEAALSKDPDINLLPTIIEKIIIPKLDKLVDRCWDPLSSSQTLKLVGILSRYIRRFPSLGPASKPLQNLFNAILHKLKGALENDVFIPVTFKLSESKSSFFQRQFASGLKLLRNITCWQGILNDNMLKEIALNSLLNRYLLSAVKVCQITDGVAKVGLISHILPRIWLQGNTPQLQMFSVCVTNFAQQLDKDNPLHFESIETLSNVLKSLRN
ncbi:hypothetical protein PPYR_09158 [Photinus pyralis]|uniref:GCF C-terminal domain-containing protein n=1 Tax=Photinus pyralis TaxID=7054 RepID=A0A1Y1M2Q1_PHOPY|nr:PAX3- and PAX7-binding protein 1 [Photinus pyralis]KAB0798165.1 hypothetical protein PPYR_09158 [Photinus pyralis]